MHNYLTTAALALWVSAFLISLWMRIAAGDDVAKLRSSCGWELMCDCLGIVFTCFLALTGGTLIDALMCGWWVYWAFRHYAKYKSIPARQ